MTYTRITFSMTGECDHGFAIEISVHYIHAITNNLHGLRSTYGQCTEEIRTHIRESNPFGLLPKSIIAPFLSKLSVAGHCPHRYCDADTTTQISDVQNMFEWDTYNFRRQVDLKSHRTKHINNKKKIIRVCDIYNTCVKRTIHVLSTWRLSTASMLFRQLLILYVHLMYDLMWNEKQQRRMPQFNKQKEKTTNL